MGIGFNETQRELVLGTSKMDPDVSTGVDAIVVDGPCAFRKYMSRTCKASMVARQVWKTIVAKFSGAKAVSVHFDVNGMLPPERKTVGIKRASKMPSLTDDEKATVLNLNLDEASPGHMDRDIPWDLVLRYGGKQKQNAWRIMAETIWAITISDGIPDVQVVSEQFSAVKGTVFGDAFARAQSKERWGEADLMVAACSQRLVNQSMKTVVVTIDYDMVLQSLCFFSTRPAAPMLIKFAKELVSANSIAEKYGDLNHRLTAALFLLTAFKSDYSNSVCRKVGMTTKALILEMQAKRSTAGKKNSASWPGETDGGKRTLTFVPRAYKASVRKLPDLDEINKHLWTIAYFSGIDGARSPAAGPPPVELPATIFSRGLPHVFATEEFPV